MKDKTKNILRRYVIPGVALLLALLAFLAFGGKLGELFNVPEETTEESKKLEGGIVIEGELLDADGSYTTKEDVGKYIYQYKRLPGNFITKDEARALGWKGGGLERFAPGKCIGGDIFTNRERTLPHKSGRVYYECDIDTLGAGARGAKRIVFSNDGLVYYTADHYDTFELMYGVED